MNILSLEHDIIILRLMVATLATQGSYKALDLSFN